MSILGFSCTVLITWEGFLVYIPDSDTISGTLTDTEQRLFFGFSQVYILNDTTQWQC